MPSSLAITLKMVYGDELPRALRPLLHYIHYLSKTKNKNARERIAITIHHLENFLYFLDSIQ